MNKNLNNAITNLEKAEAIISAIDNGFPDIKFDKSSLQSVNKAQNALYAVLDYIVSAQSDLEKLRQDEIVVDVILAAKRARNK